MIFYFTATGNSLYIAKQLNENPVSIPQVSSEKTTYSDEAIGIVCPDYAAELPQIVKNFINNNLFITDYFYLIITYGNDVSDCPEYAQKEFGNRFHYINSIKMVDNYLPVFNMDEQTAIDKKIDEQLSIIKIDIAERKKYIPQATKQAIKLHKRVAKMNKLMPSMNDGSAIKMTDGCYGCGVCTKICPIGNIVLENGKAKRINKQCEFCLACVHACPGNAIKLKMDKNPNARYRNENITLCEIIKANNQQEETKCQNL